MRLLDWYVARNVFATALFVLAAVVIMDVLFAYMRELEFLQGSYGAYEAFIFCVTTIPTRTYEFIPVAALLGALIALGMMANASELVVMRASGISVFRVISAALLPVSFLALVCLALGQWAVPMSEKLAQANRSIAESGQGALRSRFGQWFKDEGYVVHANSVLPNGKLFGLSRYEYEGEQLLSTSYAVTATYQSTGAAKGQWFLEDVKTTRFSDERAYTQEQDFAYWQSGLTPDVLNLQLVQPQYLATTDLYEFAQHRRQQDLDASRYYLAFWQKMAQPFVTMMMVLLAASFVFGSMRQVSMGARIAAGIAVGLGFRYGQDFVGQMSVVFSFDPFLAAFLPVLVFTVVAMWGIRRAG